jgi:hypothetical protein
VLKQLSLCVLLEKGVVVVIVVYVANEGALAAIVTYDALGRAAVAIAACVPRSEKGCSKRVSVPQSGWVAESKVEADI